MSEQNYTIAEEFTLPSKGLVYSDPVNPVVKLRSMTARDEMKRLAPTSMPLKTLADIIEGCMIEKPAVHVYDMISGDYEFLLHKLRIISYGSDYRVSVKCPFCGESITENYNLENLEVNQIDSDEFERLRTVELPRSNCKVTLKLQTPHALEIIDNNAKELKKKMKDANINFDTFATLNYIIDTVDGVKLSAYEQENFINRLPAIDMLKIVQANDTLNSAIGINSHFSITCPSCSEEVSTFFRFGSEFFRPTIG